MTWGRNGPVWVCGSGRVGGSARGPTPTPMGRACVGAAASTQAPDHSLRRRRQSSFLPLLCSRRGMVFPGPNGPPNTPLLFSGSLFPPQAALRRKTPLRTEPASLGSGSVFLAQTLVAFFTPQSAPSGRPPQCRPCPRRTAPRGPVGDFTCSGEVNPPCAKVLGRGPKRLYGA